MKAVVRIMHDMGEQKVEKKKKKRKVQRVVEENEMLKD